MRKIVFALVFAVLAATMSAAPASANPYDPGCNVHTGGNCGKQLASWCRTFAVTNKGRWPMPAECDRQGYGGIPQQRFYGGAPQGGYGARVTTGYQIVVVPHPWAGHRINGVFFCDSGPCPRNGIYGN